MRRGARQALLQHAQQFLLGICRLVLNIRGAVKGHGIGHHEFFRFVLCIPVPEIAQEDALIRRQEEQKVLFAFHAQEIHIEARFQLVRHGAEYIEACHQQVVNALQQRIIDHPRGFGRLADKALDHRGAVLVPEHGQRGVVIAPVAIPDQIQVYFGSVRCRSPSGYTHAWP